KKAVVAPLVAIILLMVNPIGSITGVEALSTFKVDAMYILPIAGIIGMLAMGQGKNIVKYTTSGLNKMTATVLILIGAGGVAGLISASDLSGQV
ncbi:gluconate:proton symporter, partial [Chryseobacterium mucoviscidosis]